MKNFLEKTLRQNVMIEETEYLNEKLPLAFRGRYTFYKVETNGSPWIAIQPKADVGLAVLRKDWIKIEKAAGLNCAIFFDSTSFYIKEKLLEEGIPFVLKDKQVYLPFIGYLLSNENERKISPVHLISFLTQKVILVAIYEKWENVTASKAAIRLGVTKMSANRCFDEIEYLNVDILGMKGKSRVITVPADIQKLWNDVRVILRNPVIARYELKEDIQLGKKAGITALCEYSLLSDNEYPTYAITKKEITESGIRKMKQVHSGEEIGCVVLELGYFIDFKNKKLEEFGEKFWSFVQDGKYRNKATNGEKPQFYRFDKPEDESFPKMLELFCRNDFELREMTGITPIHIDDTVSSLSAILLNDDYYKVLLEGKVNVIGLSVLRPECLILFKAKAYLDLRQRKESGETVDSNDIKKHKKDILRIVTELMLENTANLPATVKSEIDTFIKLLEQEPFDENSLKNYGIENQEVVAVLRRVFE